VSGSIRLSTIWPRVASNSLIIVGFIAVWQILVATLKLPTALFPSPYAVWIALVQLAAVGFSNTPLSTHILVSMVRILSGYLLGFVVGVPFGFLMGYSPVMQRAITPFIALMRPLPAFAYVAVLIVWFGIGEIAKVLIVFVGASTILALSTTDGVLRVPPVYRDAGRALGANWMQVLINITLPAALPQILDGARVALAQSWTCVIAAEFVAASAGIGVIVLQSADYMRTDQTVAGLILLGIIGGVTDRLLAIAQHPVAAWRIR